MQGVLLLRSTADTHVGETLASSKSAAQAAADSTSAQKKVEQSSAAATALVSSITELQATANQASADVESVLAKAKVSEESLKGILDHLAKSDETAISHEERVAALRNQLEGLIKQVEALLPGATSAGLASSFNKQRSRFTRPQTQWLWTFIACIGVLFLVALPSFFAAIGWTAHPADPSWNATWRNLTMRLPIVAPIVWLAIYAGRNYMMSLRMEEDYAYKEAISTAFEGYKREMEKIAGTGSENPTPLTILCTNILRAIAERPGRIYEGRQKDINLVTELQAIAENGAEFSKKQLAKY